jgi:hypothetical protein
MMGTREETKRSFQDLAKMASVMPKERPSLPVGPDGVSPAETPAPPMGTPPMGNGSESLATHLQSAPSASVQTPMATVLPSRPVALLAPSLPPGAAIVTAQTLRPPAWRGAWAVVMGAAMAVAMVGGLLLGQSLRSHQKAVASGQTVAPTSATVAEPPTTTVAAAPPPTAIATPPPSEPPAESPSEETPPPVTVKAPRPVHHAEPKGSAKALAAAPAPAAASIPGTKASLKASPSHSASHDSLDDLIRKSAAGN